MKRPWATCAARSSCCWARSPSCCSSLARTTRGCWPAAAPARRRSLGPGSPLVVGEMALTLVLLVSAGLLANSFVRLERVDPGFRVEQVSLVTLPLPQAKYSDGKRQTMFYQRVLEIMQARPR